MEVQHVNIKIFAQQSAVVDLGGAIAVFHRWIQRKAVGELLIDVADYRHVPDGPGVLLVAHEAHYGLELFEGRVALAYNRRKSETGTTEEKIRRSYDAALVAARRLEGEPEFAGRLKFDSGDIELIFNDRYYTPNTAETLAELSPELERFFTGLWGEGTFEYSRVGEPRDRLRIRARVRQDTLEPV